MVLNWRSVPAIWFSHMEVMRATWPSLKKKVFTCTEVNSCAAAASPSRLGLSGTPPMKSVHPASEPPRSTAPAARLTRPAACRISMPRISGSG
jgi:hypothetical protein